MNRAQFTTHFETATRHAVEFAHQFVTQSLPDEVVFILLPNRSYDGNPRVGDEGVFPGESLPQGHFHGPWSSDAVLNFLWRDGKVPEWIDVGVEAISEGRTVVALRCCGRFTAQEDLLYHNHPGGVPPFSIKSPYYPPGHDGSTRFALPERLQGHQVF